MSSLPAGGGGKASLVAKTQYCTGLGVKGRLI